MKKKYCLLMMSLDHWVVVTFCPPASLQLLGVCAAAEMSQQIMKKKYCLLMMCLDHWVVVTFCPPTSLQVLGMCAAAEMSP